MSAAHLLLVSEDQGNATALAYAQEKLAHGSQVTWICSTPRSSELAELEAAAGLKNTYMRMLNLFVITREEGQPFDVLTGQLDADRIARCSDLLFSTASITESAVASLPARQTEIAMWLENLLDDQTVKPLQIASEGTDEIGQHKQRVNNPKASTVKVAVVMQGRQLEFEMAQNTGTLLDGAEDAGIDLPFSCRGGVCSTCRAKLIRGKVELVENYALEEWELDAGFTLPCQAEPVSQEIILDYDDV